MNHAHYIEMICIMLVAGVLSTMNVWAVSSHHLYLSLNDLYMILLMTGWMLVGMSVLYGSYLYFGIGVVTVLFSVYAIRTQLFVSYKQFLQGMIPHHSMAVQMSRYQTTDFAKSIANQQQSEIKYMKTVLESM
jgi:hypothetical protein